MKLIFRQFVSLFLAAVFCLPVVAQNPRTGSQQDKPLDSKRTGFAPTAVRFQNLATQDVTTWSALPGSASVTTGTTAPDGTTGAATLSISSPPEGYRRVYGSTRTVAVGDWIIAGVWAKGVTLSNVDGSSGTLEAYSVATLTVFDATEGYRIDDEATNARAIAPVDALSDTEWRWLTTAFQVTTAVAGNQAELRFDLNCDNRHSIAFYAPVLHHIPSGVITDAEAEGLLQNLYSVPDTVPVGGVALQRNQTLYCYQSGSYVPCTSVSTGNRQAVNVKTDYGAAGDGVSDDSAEINSALTHALSTGKPLYFPAGTYLGVNLTGITYQLKIFGDGMERTILKASAGNTPIIDIGNASSHTIEISDLTIEGAGNTSGSSGHGIYVHDQSDGLYNFYVNNVWIKNCGGDGINVRGQFTNKFKSVFVSNCGGNGFDISGGNTILLDSCYVDDVLNNKVAYRIRAGQAVMLNCNGLDSLGSVSDWAVIGQAIADGDPADSYCELELIGCNIESFKRYGVWAKVGSRVSAKATFFTTSASGSNHVAIRTDFTNNQPGTIDSLCRFTVQGTGTWANGYAIHTNSDIPIMAIGRTDVTEFYSDAAATARALPSVGVTPIATVPYIYAPKLATDSLLYPTDNTGDIGASGANRPRDLNLGRDAVVGRNVTVQNGGQITQTGSVAGFLGLTATNSSTSGQAGLYAVNHDGKNAFLQVFQNGTGIAQMGSDHFPIYIKAAGTNRWYFDNLLFSPLQDDTSDLGAGSTRVKDGFFSGSLNLKERTAPSTPAANTLVIYAKDKSGASALYYKNDAGTETEIGGGGSGANTALSNLASVAINTTLVSDTNNTDDLGSSSIAWKDLYLAGTFNLLGRSDPGSPTNNDVWRSTTRQQISIRNSGQTENLSASMWKSSAQVFFDTTTTETSLIADTGVGTKTLAASRLVVGSQIRIKASGLYGTKASSPGTFTIKVKNGATTMLTIAAFTLPTNVSDQNWWIEATGALNATGASGTINWTINFYYNDGTGDMKTRTYAVNSATINTTTTNALDITGQFSVSDVANFWQTDTAIIEIF